MNLANKLTLTRIVIVPFFLVALTPAAFGMPAGAGLLLHPLALVMFIGAAITDYYDGALARRHGWVTNFGKLMDPLADKILVTAAFVSLIELDMFYAWMVVVILARELLITGLRLLATAEGRVLAADRWGKNKTISQITTIITALVFLVARDWLVHLGLWADLALGPLRVATLLNIILQAMMLFTVALTIMSGWRYGWANRDIIAEK